MGCTAKKILNTDIFFYFEANKGNNNKTSGLIAITLTTIELSVIYID